jgi:UDP-4-amino-4,6-dideoxy-N-acetyl-beta-L-altrosamine transaminase
MNIIPYGKQTILDEDIQSVVEVLKSDYLTTGPKIKEFEEALCRYSDAKYCVAVSNGTAALHLASMVLLEEGDKVLTTPNSFLATSNSILYVKAKPIFVDICEDGNIDLDACQKVLEKDSSIKAIYVVHFSGNSVNQKKLKSLREKFDIKILEDCAHSIGALNEGIKSGSCKNSDISIFSFHPVKNLTTAEGGAITTNDEELYKKLLSLRNHGMVKTEDMKPWAYEMTQLGFNYRLTDLQCALGISQLKKLDEFLEKRRALAKNYEELLKGSMVKPLYKYNKQSAYHIYVVNVDFESLAISKEELFIKMKENGILLQLHYIPINKQPFYKQLGYGDEKTPMMDKYYNEAFTLPLFPLLSYEQQKYVVDTLLRILSKER